MKKLGVLGGMGPAASAEFIVRLIQQTPASKDQDHIPFVLWNNPQIPDRSTSMRNGDDNPLPHLVEGIKALKHSGCDLIVIPCNTAHFWYHELSRLNVKIIHIVDSVADALSEIDVTNTTIGVMGTQATVEFGLYQYMLNKSGWNCITPTKEEMDTLVQPAIDLIKSGNISQAQLMLMTVINSLIDRGAKAVVLGCTEIPLAIKQTEENGIPIINSIDSLVKLAIRNFNPMYLNSHVDCDII
jgi:aspartate racemase